MNETDLSTFFAKEVPHAQPGDDQIHRFVGVPYHDGVGVEAELDIQARRRDAEMSPTLPPMSSHVATNTVPHRPMTLVPFTTRWAHSS